MTEIILKTDQELGTNTVSVGVDALTGLQKYRRMRSFFYDVEEKVFRITYEEWLKALDNKVYNSFYTIQTYFAVNITDVTPNELLYDGYFNLFNPIIEPDVNTVLLTLSGNVVRDSDTNLNKIEVDTIPLWKAGLKLSREQKVKYNDLVYRVIQAHEVTNPTFYPNVVPSLYRLAPVTAPGRLFPLWSSIGLLDSVNNWKQNDIVDHKGSYWKSSVNNNIWEPGVSQWTAYTPTA